MGGSHTSLSSAFLLSERLYKESPAQESLQKKHLSGTQRLLDASLNSCHLVSTLSPSSRFSLWVFPLESIVVIAGEL